MQRQTEVDLEVNLLTHFFFLSFTLAQFLQTNSLQFGVGVMLIAEALMGKVHWTPTLRLS